MENIVNSNFTQSQYTTVQNKEGFFYEEIENLQRPWIHESHFVPTVLVYGITFLFGIAGNSLVIFVMAGDRLNRSVTSSFLVSLALADIVYLLVCVPYETAKYFIGHWTIGTALCKIVGFTEMMTAVTSILNLTVISIERYVVIVHPMKAKRFCTGCITKMILSFVWIVSTMVSCPMIYVMNTETVTYYNNQTSVVMIYCADVGIGHQERLWVAIYRFLLMVVLPAIIIMLCYIRVIRVLWLSTKDLYKMTVRPIQRSGSDNRRSLNRHLRKSYQKGRIIEEAGWKSELSFYPHQRHYNSRPGDQNLAVRTARKQVMKMLLAVIVVFVFSWGPKLIFQIMQRQQLEVMHYQSAFTLKIILDCLPYIQSSLNPFIYGLMSRNFRQSMKTVCRDHFSIHGRTFKPSNRNLGIELDTDTKVINGTNHSFISPKNSTRGELKRPPRKENTESGL